MIDVKNIMEPTPAARAYAAVKEPEKKTRIEPDLAVGQTIYIPYTVMEISVKKTADPEAPLIEYRIDGPVIDNTEFYTQSRLRDYFGYSEEG